MTYLDLQRKIQDQPFKPFRMKLVNNTIYGVMERWMILPGEQRHCRYPKPAG